MLSWPTKDPDEVLDFGLRWAPHLDGDTISNSTWIVPDGITEESTNNDSTITTIWLSGGSPGITYIFTNRITTVGGRTMDQSVKLKCKEK